MLPGTALPPVGLAATFALARCTRGARRWGILALGPAVTLGRCGRVAEPVFRPGEAAAASVYLLFALVLALYGRLLAALGLVRAHLLRSHSPTSDGCRR